MPRTILITGANGLLGSRLAELALAAGHDVRTLTRHAWDGMPFVPVRNRFLGDLPELIPAECLVNVETVIHCAATASSDERLAQAVNVDGTGRLADFAAAAGVKTFIHLSSSTAAADSFSVYGRTKHAGEERLAASRGSMAVVVIRPNLIVGPVGRGVYGRMVGLVDRLPVIPLLGGGAQIVQPIHVDDLGAFILRAVEDPAAFSGAPLNVGHPAGMTLGGLLRMIAFDRRKRRLFIPVPLWPFEMLLRVTDLLKLKLPVNRANLQGLRQIRRADTTAAMEKAGIPVRAVNRVLEVPSPVGPGELRETRPVRILLVGAGRIGLVHAVNISRLPDAVLSGICDPNPKAVGLLRGLGFTAPSFRNLEAALAGCRPDAAIIATPPSTHLELARRCLEAGLPVLVEKPLAPDPSGVTAFEQLEHQFPGRILGGYALPLAPHVAHWFGELKSGRLGTIESASAVSLMTYVMGRGLKTWQMRKSASGGGVLMNPGVHALALVWGALGGWKGVSSASARRLHSAEVEDSLVADLDAGLAGPVRVSATWSIDGFARPEHALTLATDRGVLRLTGALGIFEPSSGDPVIAHQIDFPAGFDLAPDFAGAGFFREIELLRDLALGTPAGDEGMPVADTAAFERGVHAIYAAVKSDRFAPPPAAAAPVPAAAGHDLPNRIVDLRDLDAGAARAFILAHSTVSPWDGMEISATQLRGWSGEVAHRPSLRVTAPDFLNESRMLLSGRAGALLRQLGPRGILAAGLGALPAGIRDRGASFWAASDGLLAADLAALPSGFAGTVLLHASLTDLALALRRHDRLAGWIARCRRSAPLARIGFHSLMAAEAAQAAALVRVEAVSILTSPAGRGMGEAVAAIRRAGGAHAPQVTAEVGAAPAAVHLRAFARPLQWSHGADTVLVHACADPDLAPALQRSFAAGWAKAFPGSTAPAFW